VRPGSDVRRPVVGRFAGGRAAPGFFDGVTRPGFAFGSVVPVGFGAAGFSFAVVSTTAGTTPFLMPYMRREM
jgi:hypothetical protein